MEYTTLGDTGMTVSRLALGCLSFGSTSYEEWVLEEEHARPIIERAIELGITFFDTANVYSYGASERILGDVLAEYDRDRFVVATKVNPTRQPDAYPPTDHGGGLSRKAIEQQLTRSLERLGLDTIDLYQIHRWDYATPIAETLRVLDDAVRRNQVRYLGASSMWAYQFAEAVQTADRLGLEPVSSMQNHYNAVYREEEREMLPLCSREGVGVMPWAPFAQGYLARPHEAFDETLRSDVVIPERVRSYRANGGPEINRRVQEVAVDHGVSMAQIALAWVLHQEVVDVPIVGTTSIEHLEEAVAALEISLSDDELAYLDEPYGPVEVVGHS